MIHFGNNIYTNFAPQPIHHNKSVKLIIIGQCGIGKSRVVNNICKSSQRTGISIGSITHNIFKGQCSLPNKCSLWLMDTPGVEKNSRLTSLTLKRALRCLPWNKIVVMAKFDARFENSTLAELRKISRAFGKEPDGVAFLVSHLDIVDDRPDDVNTKEEVLESFAESLRENEFEQKVVLFSNNSSDFSKLGEALFACGADSEAKRLEIEDKQFGRALGFPNEEDPQQSTLQNGMQLISEKLTSVKVEQSQRRNAEEWKKTVKTEIEKCVSQFNAEEKEGVQAILECYVENWVEQNDKNDEDQVSNRNIKKQNDANQVQQRNFKKQNIVDPTELEKNNKKDIQDIIQDKRTHQNQNSQAKLIKKNIKIRNYLNNSNFDGSIKLTNNYNSKYKAKNTQFYKPHNQLFNYQYQKYFEKYYKEYYQQYYEKYYEENYSIFYQFYLDEYLRNQPIY